MSIEHRFNEKKRIDEYRARYRWRDDTGKLKNSKTAWFPSIKQAQKKADELKTAKEKDSALRITNKREAYIKTVFKDMFYMDMAAKVDSPIYNTHCKAIKSIVKLYFPEEVQYTKINEITPRTFRIWADAINTSKLAGSTVHKYLEVLYKFNRWLTDKGYYTDPNLELNVENTLSRFNVKSKKVGARKDRYLLSMYEVEMLTTYWRQKGLGDFYNFYHYTLWYTLAYTGMRFEEARALTWGNVDLREEERIIYIVNAVPDNEEDKLAIERINRQEYKVKTEDSRRGIPIFDFIYTLLLDYKQSYKYEFHLDDMDNCFVFPRLNHNHTFNPKMFSGRGIWLKKLKESLKACNLPNTDIGMFRHTTATFLVAPEPDGLGFTEEQVMSFFGHTSTKMLAEVYANLQRQQKTERLKKTFTGYYSPKASKKSNDIITAKERMLDRIRGDNIEEQYQARKERVYLEAMKALLNNRPYYYNSRDNDIIDELRDKINVEFIEED